MGGATMVGAATPQTVTHGFCLNDSRWIYAMLHAPTNGKIIENRAFRLAPGWYAVSLTVSAHTSGDREWAFRKEFRNYPGHVAYARGRVLGLVKIGYSLPQAACEGHRWSTPAYAIANVITEVLPFDAPGPVVRGNFGTFPLKEVQEAVRALARTEVLAGCRRKTHAQEALPEQRGIWDSPDWKARKASKTAKAIKAAKALQLKRTQHATEDRKQVSKKPSAGAQTSAMAKRAQATVNAFQHSPSLRVAT